MNVLSLFLPFYTFLHELVKLRPDFDEPIDRPSFNPHKAKYSKQVSSQDYQETDDEDYNQSGEAPTIIDNSPRNKHAKDSKKKFENQDLEKEFESIITEAVTDKLELTNDDLEAEEEWNKEEDVIYEDITTVPAT